MEEKFTWIPFYKELAKALDTLYYKKPRTELLNFIYKDIDIAYTKTLQDKNSNPLLKEDIDPFTVFAIFNKEVAGMTKQDRIEMVKKFMDNFRVKIEGKELKDFEGVPIAIRGNDRFYKKTEIEQLWELLHVIVNNDDDKIAQIYNSINTTKKVKGMYWIAPEKFISLDKHNTIYLKDKYGITIDEGVVSQYDKYVSLMKK